RLRLVSGGAGATVTAITGMWSCPAERAVAATGIRAGTGVQITMLGSGTSLGIRAGLFGSTMVWVELSGFGGSAMMGCLLYSGSPFFATFAGALPEERAGR